MADFSVGANAFLGSEHKVNVIGPNPATERGKGLHINAHPKEPLIIYPSGKYIVVKNILNPSDCFVYRGHAAQTTVAKFSPNGFWVASADISGKVRVWAWDNPEHLTKLETSVFAGPISDLDWDMESKKLVAVGDGSDIKAKCFTWDTGNSAGEMVGHAKKILSVAYKQSRPFRIITAGEDFKSIFYAGPPFKMDHSNSCHTNYANCIRYASNHTFAVSVGTDKKIQKYDGATGQPCAEVVNAHDGGIYSCAISPDSSKIATASADKTVKIWNAEDLSLIQTHTFSAEPQIGDMQLAVLWTATHLISVSLNGNVNILDLDSAVMPSKVLQSQQAGISAMCLDKVNKKLYSGSIDGVVCSRDLTNSETVRLVGQDKKNICGGAHAGKVTGIVQLGGEVFSVGWDDNLRTASAESNAYHSSSPVTGQPIALATQASAGTSAATANDLFMVVTLNEIALYRGANKVGSLPCGTLAWTPTCGALLGESEAAIGGSDSKTHIYSIASDAFRHVKDIDTRSAVSAVAYHPNGELLAIGDSGRQVEVYNRADWEPVVKGKWVFHTSKITCLSWSPSGDFLASGSLDENIFVWNLAKPAAKLQLAYAHMSGVSALDWMDEENLVSVGNDHTAVTWKINAAHVK